MLIYCIVFLMGLVVGSFVSALTWRLPREISISKGRSKCTRCKAVIAWHDNIPLVSYLILNGKCRACDKKISPRYPLIEASTAILFVVTYFFVVNCSGSPVLCGWNSALGQLAVPFSLLVTTIMLSVFVIDFEHQYIYDSFVWFLFLLGISYLLFLNPSIIYTNLLSGFLASVSLLSLNLITKGRGMGLGDVKLAVAVGIILGWPTTVFWLFLGFVIGAIIGILLLLMKKAKLGKQIAFGPFLVVSFFVVLFWGDNLLKLLLVQMQ